MRVLSLFDGISVAQQALKELGVLPEYYASEIDKYAISITQKNHPNTIQMGSVLEINSPDYQDIDLLIGGSPCQDLSIAKKNRQGLSGSRSGLFWEYVRILQEVKPKYFVLENVNSMPKEAKQVITEALGVEPIMINAALVSAQNRKRLFWTNIPNVNLPDDRGILLRDIIDTTENVIYTNRHRINEKWRVNRSGKSPTLLSAMGTGGDNVPYVVGVASRTYPRTKQEGVERKKQIEIRADEKSNAMTSVSGDSMVMENDLVRKLTPIECERLQSLPDNYTEGVSNTQRYKALGNAFNCAVIKHILKNII